MNLWTLAGTLLAILRVCSAQKIDHDKIKPIEEHEAVNVTEKLAFRYKPSLAVTIILCAGYPAVDSDGNFSGGLKPTNGNNGCTNPPLGSQVYVRIRKYKDLWAIMYVWYFPKRFTSLWPKARHDWEQVVIWIDELTETPNVKLVSASYGDDYSKFVPKKSVDSGPTFLLRVETFGPPSLTITFFPEDYNLLDYSSPYYIILWEQLPEPARAALSDDNNFGDAKFPLRDDQIDQHLEKAYQTEDERNEDR
ncbi:RxLR-like protein [Plasmopara halstedii]|uniref:RxLR-like protein n=1 Tax=Plasmopara halstedii TaxID=4781 RepID=A0A0P1AZL7_PLAHL|nr:RxLR-like protein [Plasmopara halstedii]CEG47924.1 RxLR-like protein [Plasmopara halstedii]|eukprot:XP_024584293.1 RxLR-like protein [Plasmopara halstedii]